MYLAALVLDNGNHKKLRKFSNGMFVPTDNVVNFQVFPCLLRSAQSV